MARKTLAEMQNEIAKRKVPMFADQTNLGIAKNTITGLPKATKQVFGSIGGIGKKVVNKVRKSLNWSQSPLHMGKMMIIKKRIKKTGK